MPSVAAPQTVNVCFWNAVQYLWELPPLKRLSAPIFTALEQGLGHLERFNDYMQFGLNAPLQVAETSVEEQDRDTIKLYLLSKGRTASSSCYTLPDSKCRGRIASKLCTAACTHLYSC